MIVIISTTIFFLGGGLLVYTSLMTRSEIIDEAMIRAERISSIIEKNLVSMMHAGFAGMGRSSWDEFLRSLDDLPDIDIRMVQSEAIDKQFGQEPNEFPRDEYDRLSLKTGKTFSLREKVNGAEVIRTVFPLKAGPRCLDCHGRVREGEVLGVANITVSVEGAMKRMFALEGWLITIFVLTGVLLGGALIFFLRKTVLNPIIKIKDAVQEVSQKYYTSKVEIETEDEIGELAASFNRMTEALKVYHEELIQRNQELESAYAELKEIQDQLCQAGKMSALGELAGGIAHEFKNIITAIRGFAELAQLKKDEKTISKALDVIMASSDQAKKVTDNLLSFSRPTKAQFQWTNIEDIIDVTIILLEKQLELKNIQIVRDFHLIPQVMADAGKLKQTFLNLLMNASHAMNGRGGILTVSTQIKNGKAKADVKFVEISFKDTGCGIPQENLNRIFEPFFTTKKAAGSSSISGTGLGLSLCYRYITEHKGMIKVESEVGKGTTFIITLPVEQLPEKPG